jgi:DNA-binding NarL/FixJ family response regulator
MSAEAASVVIAAGHGVVAQVVRRACEAQPGLQIVAEVHDGEALRRVCRDEHPDVIVLDELLDGVEPDLEALRALRQDGVSTAAVVLSDRSDGAAVLAALQLGARGFVRKSAGLTRVGAAVRTVVDGGRAIDPGSEQAALDALGRLARRAREGSEVEAVLTPREHEILTFVSQGLTTRQIGGRLGISPRTVETHVSKLYRKLGVRSRVQAVARAAQLGLIEL